MVASFGNVDTLSNVPALLVGTREPVSRNITLLSGENRARGTVLGKIGVGGATSAAKPGGNTGTGTLTMDATTPVRPGAKVGVYTVRFTAAAANNGTFRVEDPDGNMIGEVVMAGGAGAFDDDIKFAVADGGTDFIVGDGFDVTVAAGSAKYKMAIAAAVDGSAVPSVILAEDCDASGGDKVTVAYFAATVDENALTYGAGHTAATCREPLRDVGIDLQASIA
ncbi:head decoration protein [Bradyrhizobium sp. AUGA SZCCT0158]|uniref:head decoration protein n=1 Tax=Bradyrhizobium sp. AUGA SZCCT0158 TaxID=2807661 RepID=UPI001BADE010|nr:head decoration protein [Bradyrhizobium sp. AUGA SZCCT0158]MBR1198834.1 head decoration protein [Bradyrhizobium sp. AUGA SZCCT0158]